MLPHDADRDPSRHEASPTESDERSPATTDGGPPGPPHETSPGSPHDRSEGPPHDRPAGPATHEADVEGDRRTSSESDEARYLFVVEYGDDAERKRAEYLFNTWDEGEISRPEGLVRIAEGVDHDGLYGELLTKLRASQIASYRLEPLEAPASAEVVTIERDVAADADAVASFLRYVVSKRKGRERPDGDSYEVYSKKGRADLRFDLSETDGDTHVEIEVRGHSPALEFLAAYVEDELDAFAASQ